MLIPPVTGKAGKFIHNVLILVLVVVVGVATASPHVIREEFLAMRICVAQVADVFNGPAHLQVGVSRFHLV